LELSSDEALLAELAKRAFAFFWQNADQNTGLVNDRAVNNGSNHHITASISATGYALAALPIAVERGWITHKEAAQRAQQTLSFLLNILPHEHGWIFHFLDKRTGDRVCNSEISSIDTALLIAGALVCGQYFSGTSIEKDANRLYDRLNWDWLRTRGGKKPENLLLSHGWAPRRGFIRHDWNIYDEGMLLYLLGLGASPLDSDPLPSASWTAWDRIVVTYKERKTLTGGPLFLHQMCHGFFDLRNRRDAQGYDYWSLSQSAIEINRQYCEDRGEKWGYVPNIWGLNASDGPSGYKAYRGPGIVGRRDDGTVSPTGAIASILFTPDAAIATARTLYHGYRDRLWGQYGFANAFNLRKNWFGSDVIGIDLGMALLALENHRTGLPWQLMASHPAVSRALHRAELQF
jgi:hypothetical protein